MKRSEMVLVIAKALTLKIIKDLHEGRDRDEVPETEDAEAILQAIEEAGMDPPPHQVRQGTGYPDAYGNEETYDEWVQGWEAENG